MKILQLRFQNLNSLVGEWSIDFSDPAFVNDGIFAITGPTGAGKTTVLDAICLALYGRTPRLPRINKSGNELMSRQTGECFSEVTFETAHGRFRCHWSQHRARRNPEGDLQLPKHEVADADSGKLLESKLRNVAARIVKATGMDFDRFTRSMLLAQGGFAAFLQAAPDERAPILEQITGTEIYSQISIRVHERRVAEQRRLDALQAALVGMQLLDEAQEKHFEEVLAEKNDEISTLGQHIEEKKQAIDWLDGIGHLETALQDNAQHQKAWQVRAEKFQPEQERLNFANRALELEADFTALTALRAAQQKEQKQHALSLQQLPAQQQVAARAAAAQQAARSRLDQYKAEFTKVLPIIQEVRDLDLKIGNQNELINAVSTEIARREKVLAQARAHYQRDLDALAELQGKQDVLVAQIEQSQGDEALVAELEGIRSRIEALRSLNVQQAQREERLSELMSRQQEVEMSVRTGETILAEQRAALKKSREALRQHQEQLVEVLEQRDLAVWRQQQAELVEQANDLSRLRQARQDFAEAKASFGKLAAQKQQIVREQTSLATELEQQKALQTAHEEKVALLEKQLVLLNRIQSYEEARHTLQDDEPCPLCGAKEHPWAAGNIPVDNETDRVLTRAREAIKTAAAAVNALEIRQAQWSRDLETMADREQEFSRRMDTAQRDIVQICARLPLEADDPGLDEKCTALQQKIAKMRERTERVVQAAETLEKQLVELREKQENAQEAELQATHEQQALQNRLALNFQAVHREEEDMEQVRADSAQALHRLRQEVGRYTSEAVNSGNLETILQRLNERRALWISRQQQKIDIGSQIDKLDVSIRHQREQLTQSAGELEKTRSELDAQKESLSSLEQMRRTLFDDRNPKEEEARLRKIIDSAEQTLDRNREESQVAHRALEQLQSVVSLLETAIASRAVELEQAEHGFGGRLAEAGFADEAMFAVARLDAAERKVLAEQARKLAEEKTMLATRQDDLMAQLKAERDRQLTTQRREALTEALDNLLARQKNLQQEIGAIREKLENNRQLKAQQQDRLQAIEVQQRECQRWDLLHELIGSADGKKFRNFAQGLTFEMMIAHANRQLQKMSERYLLARDESQPLELNVIDNYQAGEIRSTKNLSGGESFIVSLALALGLSRMASQNVRVDSLFLDEGFGTLDEEALETALATLSSLQQDGKLIGVISHVGALKERIPTQIEVTSGPGGRSVISGPGCG